MKRFLLALLVCSCSCTSPRPTATPVHAPQAKDAEPTVTLVHGTAGERATAVQLDRVLAQYDLRPWLYTRAFAIDEDAIPHSHPVLTLHARHLKDDLLFVSTLIHEETHWYLVAHQPDVDAAVKELKALAPGLPVGFPDGADNETSSYEHLIVIALEERGVRKLAGELAAHEVMEFWAGDHYRALYRFVMARRPEVWRILEAHGLGPPASPLARM